MWNGSVINICDGRDLVNVVFQSKHLNRIIVGLRMFSPLENYIERIKKILLRM
jgi:hypothetical protein